MSASEYFKLGPGCALFLLLAGGTAGGAAGGQIELVSRVDPGAPSDTASGSAQPSRTVPAISRDGRYVAFLSAADNLVSGQVDRNTTNGQGANDVFLYDRVARTTVLVSHDAASATTGGNGGSGAPVISADGRWVVFPSQATNMVDGLPDDFHGQSRLFLYDRVTEALTLVSSSAYLETSAGFGAGAAAISADGRFIAYVSDAPDLVPGQQDANQSFDVFLYDRTARTTVLVSRAATPAATAADSASPYLSMSADGRFIAFNRRPLNPAGGLGDGEVLLYDRLAATVTPIAPGGVPTISADGGSVAFLSSGRQVIPGQVDTNGAADDVFLYSHATGRTVLVSHAAGRPTTTGNGASDPPDVFPPLLPLISADDRHVAFFSRATNLVPRQATPGGALFLYDRTSGTVILASRKGSSATTSANGLQTATMSADGRFIAFDTLAADQLPGQIDFNAGSDVFLFDGKAETTILVSARDSHGSLKTTGDGPSYSPAISADGAQIAFYGTASDLVAGVRDLNNGEDLFLYTVAARSSAVATLHAPGLASASPDADSVLRAVSTDGRWVLFEGDAVNLVPGQIDGNHQSDVFLYDHATRKTLLVSRSSAATATAATAANGPSDQSALSADGRYAVFTSDATNLDPTVSDSIAPGTGQRRLDVFLFDRVTGKTIALSRSARHPGFTGDGDSSRPALSADGRWVAFMSQASDLVPATGTATGNAYLYDRVAGVLARTNAIVTSVVNPRPLALSADGRYLLTLSRGVGFNVFLYDRVTGTNTLVSHDPSGAPAGVFQGEIPALSADGRFVAFTSGRGDLGGEPGGDVNVYLWDREGGGLTLLGVSSLLIRNFVPRLPTLSADGGRVAFLSNAETPTPGFDNPGHTDQVVLYDRTTGTSTLATASAVATGQGDQGSATDPAITPDGRRVAFTSQGSNLLPGVATMDGIYLYDHDSAAISLVAPAFGIPLPSADGRFVAFESTASNLVARDFNGVRSDVFLFSQTP
jgi:Tol biopolymer transport system component